LSKIEHALSWPKNWAIFAWHMTDFCGAILLADKNGRFCCLSDILFSLIDIPQWCCQTCQHQWLCHNPADKRTWSSAGSCRRQTQSADSRSSCNGQSENCLGCPTPWSDCPSNEWQQYSSECAEIHNKQHMWLPNTPWLRPCSHRHEYKYYFKSGFQFKVNVFVNRTIIFHYIVNNFNIHVSLAVNNSTMM